MIIEFQDRWKRQLVVDTKQIACLIENVDYARTGKAENDDSGERDGTWSVVLHGGQFFWEVDKAMKDLIQIAWEQDYNHV